MSFFSRLTDIVTCNISHILANEEQPNVAIAEIIREMEEGLAGATRSVKTALANEQRIQDEVREHESTIAEWVAKAKESLAANDEARARSYLVRKREIEDLIAGLEQQLKAATATREHLTTTLRALEARMAEAKRKQQEINEGEESAPPVVQTSSITGAIHDAREYQVDEELEALKRELGG